MPIYCYACECGRTEEKIARIDALSPVCTCGQQMGRVMTYPAMVKIRGEGGYPSRRKFVKGTAPGTTRSTKAWLSEDPTDSRVNYMGTRAFEANKERKLAAPAPI